MNWKVHCSKLLGSSPWHSYSHTHGRFLTITFAPWRTCTTSFLSWRRRSTAVLANESVISSLTVENVHLAHGQRQYPSAFRVSSTNIQGRSRKSILIMLLARFIFFRAEEGKQKSEVHVHDSAMQSTQQQQKLCFLFMCLQFSYAQIHSTGLSSSRTDQTQQIGWEGEVCQQLQMDWYQKKQKTSKDQTTPRDHVKPLTSQLCNPLRL